MRLFLLFAKMLFHMTESNRFDFFTDIIKKKGAEPLIIRILQLSFYITGFLPNLSLWFSGAVTVLLNSGFYLNITHFTKCPGLTSLSSSSVPVHSGLA